MVQVTPRVDPPTPSFSILLLLWAVLGLFVMPLVIIGMARVKTPTVRSEGDGGEGGSGASPVAKKRKTSRKSTIAADEPVETDRMAVWVRKLAAMDKKPLTEEAVSYKESIMKRDAICERKVDSDGLDDNLAFRALERKGLHIAMAREMEYDLQVVREFYAGILVNRGDKEMAASVQGHVMLLTPDWVASYLGYTRPTPEQVILGQRPFRSAYDRAALVEELCERPMTWLRGALGVGQLKPHFQLLAKILQYNIFPRGNYKRLGLREAELLVACVQSDAIIDFASWIFYEIVDFAMIVNPKVRMPFPVMITELARQSGVTLGQLTKGLPGPISTHTVAKARAQAKGRVDYADDFEPGRTLGHSVRMDQWMKAMYSRQTVMIREIRDLRRDVDIVKNRTEFLLQATEEQVSRSYVPLPDEERPAPPQPPPPAPRTEQPAAEEPGLQDEEDSQESEASDDEEEESEASDDEGDGPDDEE